MCHWWFGRKLGVRTWLFSIINIYQVNRESIQEKTGYKDDRLIVKRSLYCLMMLQRERKTLICFFSKHIELYNFIESVWFETAKQKSNHNTTSRACSLLHFSYVYLEINSQPPIQGTLWPRSSTRGQFSSSWLPLAFVFLGLF